MVLKQFLFLACAIVVASSEKYVEQGLRYDSENVHKAFHDESVVSAKTSYEGPQDITQTFENREENDQTNSFKYNFINHYVPSFDPANSSVFDERYDTLPQQCKRYKSPANCAEATECTQKSGYYYISGSHHSDYRFLAFCEFSSEEGDWTYILRRVDGSENFTRSWSDYVKGFGNVAGEHWIGLDNLYDLTNYGPQELHVFVENFEGSARVATYDNFLIGGAGENYILKSLGRYAGTAGDCMACNIGQKFSTYDNEAELEKYAFYRKGGWWYSVCSMSNPTGIYYREPYQSSWYHGVVWSTFGGGLYSQKTIIMKIRRQRI